MSDDVKQQLDTVAAKLRRQVASGIRLFVFFLHDRVQRQTLELLAERVIPAVGDGS